MPLSKSTDILANIFVPLVAGMFVYWLQTIIDLPTLVNAYLADALWAYALVNSLLLVWNRAVNVPWIAAALLLMIGFEVLQHYHIVAGVGDAIDVLVYVVATGTALLINSLFLASRVSMKAP